MGKHVSESQDERGPTRRRFLKGIGSTAAAGTVATVLSGCTHRWLEEGWRYA